MYPFGVPPGCMAPGYYQGYMEGRLDALPYSALAHPSQQAAFQATIQTAFAKAVVEALQIQNKLAGQHQFSAEIGKSKSRGAPCKAAAAGGQRQKKQQPKSRPDDLAELDGPVLGRVWKLSKHPDGCRKVQSAFDEGTYEEKLALASELRGHVSQALKCPNANYVIQKCIEALEPCDSQFIIDELVDCPQGASKCARHKYGCRILKKLLERCSPEQVDGFVSDLSEEAVILSRNNYANFVIQHILIHGTQGKKERLVEILTQHASEMCDNQFGADVLNKALEETDGEMQKNLSHALLEKPDKFAAMAGLRHGHQTAKLALKVADDERREATLSALEDQQGVLQSSRYGRVFGRSLSNDVETESANTFGRCSSNDIETESAKTLGRCSSNDIEI